MAAIKNDQGVRAQLRERGYPPVPLVMRQRWLHLLFLHWRFDPIEVQRSLPPGLEADLWDGAAWVGIVPFAMRGVRPRFCPAVPSISAFLELNLRTYVRDRFGRPGIWFYSLDASQPVAVWTARAFFSLPYRHSRMRLQTHAGGQYRFSSRRRGTGVSLQYRYRPMDRFGEAAPGSLEFFLVERYRLFAFRRNGLFTGRVYHAPYQLQTVETAAWSDDLFALDGLTVPCRRPDHQVYAHRLEVGVFAPERVPG